MFTYPLKLIPYSTIRNIQHRRPIVTRIHCSFDQPSVLACYTTSAQAFEPSSLNTDHFKISRFRTLNLGRLKDVENLSEISFGNSRFSFEEWDSRRVVPISSIDKWYATKPPDGENTKTNRKPQLTGRSILLAKSKDDSTSKYHRIPAEENPGLRTFGKLGISSKVPSFGLGQGRHHYSTKSGSAGTQSSPKRSRSIMSLVSQQVLLGITGLLMGGGLFYILNKNGFVQPLPATRLRSNVIAERQKRRVVEERKEKVAAENAESLSKLPFKDDTVEDDAGSAWDSFSAKLATLSSITDFQWASLSDSITSYIIPEGIRKLQRELSMAPGSLADEIWQEAHDPFINPEIERSASVRFSTELCSEEQDFLRCRKQVAAVALAKYLNVPEESVHPEDVPTIAMAGSGGGLRALIATTGSMLAASEDGLFDCVTYTAGVSGSCWAQILFNSSLGGRRFDKMVEHLKNRLGIHIAYPPIALSALNSAPTNKFLLSGFVEKLKGDKQADIGLVDIYGLLLSARLLVPRGEIGVENRDLKLSDQASYIKHGESPMPIYTAVRHEIPASQAEKESGSVSETTKEKAKKENYFQWFELTPYEMFCEEFFCGIPTWAIGRKFEGGHDVPMDENGLHVPELRLPLLLGIFGSAFCATLSHYYKEVRPLVKGLAGFASIENIIGERNELSAVHPINPASLPNFLYGMEGKLPETIPQDMYEESHIQLMDAGMSNNLPIYPLLRPGRNVDILIAFDASADIKTENWLSVADGYARQRGIKGWPMGAGWPKESDTVEKTTAQLEEAQAKTAAEAEKKLEDAKNDPDSHLEKVDALSDETKTPSGDDPLNGRKNQNEDSGDLGYCTVWVGSTEERSYAPTDPPPSKAKAAEDWQLMEPDAGIAVVYFPFLANPKVKDVDPATSDFMSTWNFVYTPEEVDKVVELSKANFSEGSERVKKVVRAVWERKRRQRMERESREDERRERLDGDHFS